MLLHKKNKGIALILVYLLLLLLVIFLGTFFYAAIQAMKISQNRINSTRAFYAAESGLDVALQNLSNPLSTGNLGGPPVTAQYVAASTPLSPTEYTISSTGYSPSSTASPRAEVTLQAAAEIIANDEFFDNALYSASNLTLKGNAYNITGDVFYNEDGMLDVAHPENITGTITAGEPIDFSTDIDYNLLYTMAQAQQASDVFDHVVDVDDWGSGSFPADFWYDEPNGIPNVIYVEGAGDLDIGGNVNIGGFLVITSGDCQISGTVTLEGCLLATDDLKVSGTVNATGGLWAGGVIDDEGGNKDGAFISGNITLTFDQTFMDAIENMNFLSAGTVVLTSWQETGREAF